MSGDELCRRLSVAANLTLSAPRYSAVKKSRFTAEQRRAQRNPNVTSRVGLAVFLIASFVLHQTLFIFDYFKVISDMHF